MSTVQLFVICVPSVLNPVCLIGGLPQSLNAAHPLCSQGVAKNWLWSDVPSSKRENKIYCPPVSKTVSTPAGDMNPYQKPLPLYWEFLDRYTRPGDLVVELTGGSGTLAMACATFFRDRTGE